MEVIEFSKETTKWFKSYLSKRKLKVHIKNTLSKLGNLICEVFHGPITWPQLFSLYINDIPQAVDCELLLFDDDTCVTFQHKDICR